jgi:hypothetical protein
MCGACGILGGGPDWIDRVGNPDGVGHNEDLTRGAERQRRINLVNLLLRESRCLLIDTGTFMVLRGPTGRTEVVTTLMHVWASVDRVASRRFDPLDAALLGNLGAAQPVYGSF